MFRFKFSAVPLLRCRVCSWETNSPGSRPQAKFSTVFPHGCGIWSQKTISPRLRTYAQIPQSLPAGHGAWVRETNSLGLHVQVQIQCSLSLRVQVLVVRNQLPRFASPSFKFSAFSLSGCRIWSQQTISPKIHT